MFATLVSATLFFTAAIQGAHAGFAINTPDLIQCESTHVSWSKTAQPYNLVVVASDKPCDDPLLELGDHNGTTMSWVVDLPVGSQVLFSLLDGNDEEAWSGNMTVKAGSNSSCLSGATSSSAAATSSATAGATDVSNGSGTTLVVTGIPTDTSTGTQVGATPVGAANAGAIPNSNGALSTVRFSQAAAFLGSTAAVVAIFAL